MQRLPRLHVDAGLEVGQVRCVELVAKLVEHVGLELELAVLGRDERDRHDGSRHDRHRERKVEAAEALAQVRLRGYVAIPDSRRSGGHEVDCIDCRQALLSAHQLWPVPRQKGPLASVVFELVLECPKTLI